MLSNSDKNFITIMLLGFAIVYVGFGIQSKTSHDYSLRSTVARGNREIAVEFSVHPRFRWMIAAPWDGIIHRAGGEHPHHEFANITYGTETSGPPSMPGDRSSKMPLTDEEWQSIDQWRSVWCQGAPLHLISGAPEVPVKSIIYHPPAATEAFYTVVFRCIDHREIKTVHVLPDQMPLEIAILLRRAAEPPVP